MLTAQDGENAFSYDMKIKANEQKRRELAAENAMLLSTMKKHNLYKAILGDENAEWSGYLGQIEVMYSRNDVYNMIRIYDKFTNELNIKYESICDIPKSRLLDIISIVDASNVVEWCDKARVLINQDWAFEVRNAKGLKTEDTCTHTFCSYEVCKDCGLKHKLDVVKE
jgi:hypothetical protein